MRFSKRPPSMMPRRCRPELITAWSSRTSTSKMRESPSTSTSRTSTLTVEPGTVGEVAVCAQRQLAVVEVAVRGLDAGPLDDGPSLGHGVAHRVRDSWNQCVPHGALLAIERKHFLRGDLHLDGPVGVQVSGCRHRPGRLRTLGSGREIDGTLGRDHQGDSSSMSGVSTAIRQLSEVWTSW